MFSDGEVVAAFLALAACAAIASAITPKPRGWNNSRAATQRDLADVLAGRGRGRDRRGDEAIALLLILMAAAVVVAGS